MTLLRRSSLVAILIMLALIVAPTTYAAEIRSDESITIAAGETIDDDLYLFGAIITIDGTVRGDVVAAGETVVVNGVVEGSLWAAGSQVVINGRVDRSVRAGAYSVTIGPEARLGRDLLVGSYSLIAQSGSQIQGDVAVGSYQARLDGEIGRDYTGGQVALVLNGVVRGDVVAEVDGSADGGAFDPSQVMPGAVPVERIAPGFRIGEGARIGGALRYTSATDATIAQGAVIQGSVVRSIDPAVQQQAQAAATAEAAGTSPLGRLLDIVRDLVTLLVIGLLLVWLMPGFMTEASNMVATRPLPSIGWSFIGVIGMPIVLIALAIVTVSLGIGLGALTLSGLAWTAVLGGLVTGGALLFGFITAAAWISKIVVSLTIGRLLQANFPSLGANRFWAFVIGLLLVVAVLGLLSFAPLLAGVIDAVVSLLGLGAIVLALWESRASAPPPRRTLVPSPTAS